MEVLRSLLRGSGYQSELRNACRSCTATIPHICGTHSSLHNIVISSTHLVPYSSCEVEDKGYYPHFIGEETRVQGGQVLAWPRSLWELPYSQVWLNPFDLRSKALCSTWGVGLAPSGLGWAPSSSPHGSCPPLLSLMMSLSPWCCFGKHYWNTALNHQDLSGFDSQKVRRDGLSITATLKHPPHTPDPTVLKFGAWDVFA